MRSGNNKETEFTSQIGFNGFEIGMEGPSGISNSGQQASYLVNFRYSTIEVLNKIGFDFGTGTAIPQYKDLTFIYDLPGTKLGRFKVIGLWGKSYIELGREPQDTTANSYNLRGGATDFGSELGFIGVTNTYFFDKNSSLKTTVSHQYSRVSTEFDSVFVKENSLKPIYRGKEFESKSSITTEFRKKVDSRNNYSLGVIYDNFNLNYTDSAYAQKFNHFITIAEVNRSMSLLRGFAQWQHNFSNNLTVNAGIYSQYLEFNNKGVTEPRLGLRWTPGKSNTFTFGAGMHSQLPPRIIYFTQKYDDATKTYSTTNDNLGFAKSNHYVAGYQRMINPNLRIKAEAYFQNLYEIPVVKNPSTEYQNMFSMVLAGDFFSIPQEDNLVNEGKGINKGIELTIEKFLNNGYYFLATASIFDSKYSGGDGIWRNSSFNGNYVFNVLGGYEFKINNKSMLTLDAKSVLAGGRRYTPIDLQASIAKHETVYEWDKAWQGKHDDYFRTDVRVGLKVNGKKISQEWAIDLQNITGYQSIFMESFDADKNEIYQVYQQGFYPMFLYRINF